MLLGIAAGLSVSQRAESIVAPDDPGCQSAVNASYPDFYASFVVSPDMLGDAVCDYWLNVADCGWDNGDCCAETCLEPIGLSGCPLDGSPYDCRDPDHSNGVDSFLLYDATASRCDQAGAEYCTIK